MNNQRSMLRMIRSFSEPAILLQTLGCSILPGILHRQHWWRKQARPLPRQRRICQRPSEHWLASSSTQFPPERNYLDSSIQQNFSVIKILLLTKEAPVPTTKSLDPFRCSRQKKKERKKKIDRCSMSSDSNKLEKVDRSTLVGLKCEHVPLLHQLSAAVNTMSLPRPPASLNNSLRQDCTILAWKHKKCDLACLVNTRPGMRFQGSHRITLTKARHWSPVEASGRPWEQEARQA